MVWPSGHCSSTAPEPAAPISFVGQLRNPSVTAQQMAVAQLTVAYCQALTSDVSRRASFFSGVDFNQPATVALGVDNRDLVTAPLIASLAVNTDAQGGQLTTQPDTGAIKVLLDLLLDDLLANGTADTQAMVMATCAASFGHAGMLVQ